MLYVCVFVCPIWPQCTPACTWCIVGPTIPPITTTHGIKALGTYLGAQESAVVWFGLLFCLWGDSGVVGGGGGGCMGCN